jgi:hypothetical protein
MTNFIIVGKLSVAIPTSGEILYRATIFIAGGYFMPPANFLFSELPT